MVKVTKLDELGGWDVEIEEGGRYQRNNGWRKQQETPIVQDIRFIDLSNTWIWLAITNDNFSWSWRWSQRTQINVSWRGLKPLIFPLHFPPSIQLKSVNTCYKLSCMSFLIGLSLLILYLISILDIDGLLIFCHVASNALTKRNTDLVPFWMKYIFHCWVFSHIK